MEEITIQHLTESEIERHGIGNWPVWSCGVSVFDWHYDQKESCLVLEGEVLVTTAQGEVQIRAGDYVEFARGLSCRWNITKPIKKR